MPVVFKDKALFNEQGSWRKGQLYELLIVWRQRKKSGNVTRISHCGKKTSILIISVIVPAQSKADDELIFFCIDQT